MRKITIFLCVAILAAGSNAFTLSSSLDQAQQSLNDMIENTIQKVKGSVDEAKKKAADLIGQVQAQAQEYSKKLSADIMSKAQKALDEVTKLTNDVEDVDVSECSKLGNELLSRAQQALIQMKKCFVDKSNQATTYVQNMVKVADDTLKSLKVFKSDAHMCIKNMDGFFGIGKALVCTNGVAAEAGWHTMKAVPLVSVEATKLTFLLTTLPSSLSTCTSTKALTAFYYETSVIVEKTMKCIKEKINEIRPEEPSFPDPTTPEIPVFDDPAISDFESQLPDIPNFEMEFNN